eukprot:15353557-Ditylum_brightwellii.AAC.1
MVLVAHLPVVAVGDIAVEARVPTPEQLELAEANETHVAAASAYSYVPNGGDGQAGAFLLLGIALVE